MEKDYSFNDCLDFEEPIAAMAKQISDLKNGQHRVNIKDEVSALQAKLDKLLVETYSQLTPWQVVQVARHRNRPKTLDYINELFTNFIELHGDRHFADDNSIIGGFATFNDHRVMVIGHQKGRNTQENILYNFGMSLPEGYRKALRLMKLAEKFSIPVVTLVDTPGAYPGIGAEERNQSEAIGRNIYEMSQLRVPIIATIIGEGGSGGALAIAMADIVGMLEYSVYSVISPEGCASILWKDATKANIAADALGITAAKLKDCGLIDYVISESPVAAHINRDKVMSNMKKYLQDNLNSLLKCSASTLLDKRYARVRSYGCHTV